MTDEQTLRQFKTVMWPRAYRTQDVALLDEMLDDSFEMIDAEGNRSTKQDELAWVRDNAWDPGEFEYVIERLAIYGDRFAIIDTVINNTTNSVIALFLDNDECITT